MTDTEKKCLYDFTLLFSVPTDFVEVKRIDGLKFIIHSNENCGHNRGHVHIEAGDAEIEIDLLSFKIINASGKISPKKIKLAQKFVQDNQQLFIDNWNEFSNGVKISIA